MSKPQFVFKIDVDTDRGTQIGVDHLRRTLSSFHIPATFLFCLGPDNTGRALKKIFKRGFFKKVSRTSVLSTYGLKTVLSGVLWPGPHIGKRHQDIMRNVRQSKFDVGIHAYDHNRWQDGVTTLPTEAIKEEFQKALTTFKDIFNDDAKGAGAPGWQANEKTLKVYDEANLSYGSDCRGKYPFIPKIGNQVFKTLQIPTTLPTLDELIGDPKYPIEKWTEHFLSLLSHEHPNVMTIHAELEGMKYLEWFQKFLDVLQHEVEFTTLLNLAKNRLENRDKIPVCELIQAEVPNRSGLLAHQQT